MFRCERAEPPADVRLGPYRRAAARRVGAAQRVPEFEDGIVGADELDEELRDWASGCFRLRDRRFTLEWLGEDETDAVHGEHGWTSG